MLVLNLENHRCNEIMKHIKMKKMTAGVKDVGLELRKPLFDLR